MSEITLDKSTSIAAARHEINEAEQEWMSAWLAAEKALKQMTDAKDRLNQAHEAFSRAEFSS